MSVSGEKFMRLIVFFDLPTKEKSDRFEANRFRRFLLNDGYHMLQLSVYSRLCKGQDTVEKHINRLKCSLPPEGSVRVMQVTEKQYSRMDVLVGMPKKEEKIGAEQLVLL